MIYTWPIVAIVAIVPIVTIVAIVAIGTPLFASYSRNINCKHLSWVEIQPLLLSLEPRQLTEPGEKSHYIPTDCTLNLLFIYYPETYSIYSPTLQNDPLPLSSLLKIPKSSFPPPHFQLLTCSSFFSENR